MRDRNYKQTVSAELQGSKCLAQNRFYDGRAASEAKSYAWPHSGSSRVRADIEPFAGSACLFFALAPARSILGDNNESLIELFYAVREDPDRLFDRMCRIRRDAATYYRWRDKDPHALDAETRAVRFLYLNRNCFNGIFRTNAQGRFNVPIGTRTGALFTRGAT